MPPQREHTVRSQRFNQIGEVGRITGIEPPKDIPRDSAGHENPSAFFDEADSTTATASQSQSQLGASPASKHTGEDKTGRARERPDRFNEIGERGRKTGIKPPKAVRQADGFEDPDAFFQSPSPLKPSKPSPALAQLKKSRLATTSTTTTAPLKKASPAKKVSPSRSARKKGTRVVEEEEVDEHPQDDPFHHGFGGGGSDEDDELLFRAAGGADDGSDEEVDMDVDDGTSLTPSTFLRSNGVHKSAPSPGRRAAAQASASNSTRPVQLSSKAQGKRRKVSSSPEPGVQVPEEVFSSSKGKGRSSLGGGKSATSRKRVSLIEPTEDDEEEGGFELGDGADAGDDAVEEDPDHHRVEEEEVASSPHRKSKSSRTSDVLNVAPSPKLNGKVKAKAKASAKEKKGPAPRKHPRDESGEDDGVRRSSRQRLEPLEYWRNERVIYKRRPSGMGINAVVRIPKPPAESLVHKGRHRSHTAKRGQSARIKSEIPEEEGVDDMTDPDGIVWSWEGNEEVTRRIAFTAKMMDPQPLYQNNKFGFQKIFAELDYLAGGILHIPSGSEKATKPAKDNSYIFYCIEGSVSVIVHRSHFAIGPGGTFLVPRGNTYSITATSNRDVKLFFTQGRRVVDDAVPEESVPRNEPEAEGSGGSADEDSQEEEEQEEQEEE